MGISGLDGFADAVTKQMLDVLHEETAQALAERMRELGRTDVDNVNLELKSDTSDPSMQVDGERVKRRAAEILAQD